MSDDATFGEQARLALEKVRPLRRDEADAALVRAAHGLTDLQLQRLINLALVASGAALAFK